MPTHVLWLLGEGTEPPDKRRPIPSLVGANTDYKPPSRGYEVLRSGDLFWYGRFRSLVGRDYQRGVHPYQRGLTCCHSDHDNYVCSHGSLPESSFLL
jgi:hypothetical protein